MIQTSQPDAPNSDQPGSDDATRSTPPAPPARAGTPPHVTVRFELPREVDATEIAVVGDFNDWSLDATLMERSDAGTFSVEVDLEAGRVYHYRYLLDGERWENDWNADYYAPNAYGGDDSVIDLRRPRESAVASEDVDGDEVGALINNVGEDGGAPTD